MTYKFLKQNYTLIRILSRQRLNTFVDIKAIALNSKISIGFVNCPRKC